MPPSDSSSSSVEMTLRNNWDPNVGTQNVANGGTYLLPHQHYVGQHSGAVPTVGNQEHPDLDMLPKLTLDVDGLQNYLEMNFASPKFSRALYVFQALQKNFAIFIIMI
jgi:hypothetical protein